MNGFSRKSRPGSRFSTVARHVEHFQVGLLLAIDPLHHFLSVHSRHRDVGQHQPHGLVLKRVERFGGTRSFEHLIAVAAQHGAAETAHSGFVFDDQHDIGFFGLECGGARGLSIGSNDAWVNIASFMLNLSAVLEQHARRRPDAEALVCGDKRLTYAQLNAWANQIANALAASGIRRGDHVALAVPEPAVFSRGLFRHPQDRRDRRAAERAAEAARDCLSPARQRREGDVLLSGHAGAADGGSGESGDRRGAGVQAR